MNLLENAFLIKMFSFIFDFCLKSLIISIFN